MALYICNSCSQHIVQPNACPYCTKPHAIPKNAVLGIPMAIMLGLGCSKKETAPTPEIMALYGGPPIEVEEMELQADTAKEDEETENNTAKENDANRETNTQSSGDNTNVESEDEASDKAEIKPDPVEEMVKPLYGVDVAPVIPVEPEK